MVEVNLETVIYSDEWRGDDGLVNVDYNKHWLINYNQWYGLSNRQHVIGIKRFGRF